ncbi:hypothetical protein [Aneurinibacillus aneurinilyticus]|jgi:hypothetical protein|uniref:Homing endonuclease LAGLIDADG domain-containing protein n=1 Tax=Aneurinibacillus aneurinilyticus TaxID=1391 RepID=A0A848D276_ANEAE|nr:hypothetical protein [Aneurinibacillus aneurinilyticus]NMF00027.1 hypothetical protein [Aneurinibacillus aneurinilyticus]
MRELFKELNLSGEFIEHMIGLLLGDGYFSNQNKCKYSSQFIVTNVNPSYIYALSKLFTEEGIDHIVKIKEKKGSFPGSKMSSSIYTKFYVTFAEFERKWYETRSDGTHFKVVPADLKLTPISLLQWYIGDGYLVNLKGEPQRVQFCTERYTDDEIVFLRDCFLRDFDLDIQIDWSRRRLRIPKRKLNDFFEILPECPSDFKSELGYKWA